MNPYYLIFIFCCSAFGLIGTAISPTMPTWMRLILVPLALIGVTLISVQFVNYGFISVNF